MGFLLLFLCLLVCLFVFGGFPLGLAKGQNISMDNSIDVKMETKGERKQIKQNPLSKAGKRICRAYEYITGDMKEFGAWLKGKATSA